MIDTIFTTTQFASLMDMKEITSGAVRIELEPTGFLVRRRCYTELVPFKADFAINIRRAVKRAMRPKTEELA